MDVRVRADHDAEHLTLHCIGELDLLTAGQIGEALHAAHNAQFTKVTLDISGVGFCGCAGLSAMIEAHETISTAGGELHIRGVRAPVRRLIELAGCEWLMSTPFAPLEAPESRPHCDERT